MPYILGALSFVLFIICIVHAIRNDRVFPWIYILIFLPGIGSLIYLFMEIVPSLVTARQTQTVRRKVGKLASPNRDLIAAKREVEMVGSADAKRRLAEEYAARGQYGDAIGLYRSALTGAHADDPAMLYALARAQLENGDGAGAQASLDALQAAHPKLVSADAHLVYARALEAQSRYEEALTEYARLVPYSTGEEARCRYALLLQKTGNTERAYSFFAEIVKTMEGAPRHYRAAQREWADIARRNLAV